MRFFRICLALLVGWGLNACAPELQEATTSDAWAYQLEQRDCVDSARTMDEAVQCRMASYRKCQASFLDGCPAPLPR